MKFTNYLAGKFGKSPRRRGIGGNRNRWKLKFELNAKLSLSTCIDGEVDGGWGLAAAVQREKGSNRTRGEINGGPKHSGREVEKSRKMRLF